MYWYWKIRYWRGTGKWFIKYLDTCVHLYVHICMLFCMCERVISSAMVACC